MNIGDIFRILARKRPVGLLLRDAKFRRSGSADGGIEPVVERHAGTARRGFGPLAGGCIDPFSPPRYARIHALVRFELGSASPAPPASPRVPLKRQSNSAQVVCLWIRLFRVTVNNGLRSEAGEPKNWHLAQIQPTVRSHAGATQVVAGARFGSLTYRVPPKVLRGADRLLRCKNLPKGTPPAFLSPPETEPMPSYKA